MLIVTALNVTGNGKLARQDGTSDYDVWVGINHHMIWRGNVKDHVRDAGAAVLLRTIADRMEEAEEENAARAHMRGPKLDKLQPGSEDTKRTPSTRNGRSSNRG